MGDVGGGGGEDVWLERSGVMILFITSNTASCLVL